MAFGEEDEEAPRTMAVSVGSESMAVAATERQRAVTGPPNVANAPADRMCPQCRLATGAKYCPEDGTPTVVANQSGDPRINSILDGRYRIDRQIGKGGFGTVYQATQLAIGRAVAIKFLNKELSDNDQASQRFSLEAKAIAGLKHSNIIELYDFGRAEDGALFLVVEYLEGEPLDKRLDEQGALPPLQVVEIGLQALDALAEAHYSGVIHRDLKPENLYMAKGRRRKEVVKLLDFGIAKIAGDTSKGMSLTQTGIAIGSPRYMSPEQCAAKPVSPQSDLYSLGLILFECLTGQPVFQADNLMGYLMAHVNQKAPHPELDGKPLRGPLIDLIMSCLEKKAAKRPPSAAAALEALRKCRNAPLVDVAEEEEEAAPTLRGPSISQAVALQAAQRPGTPAEVMHTIAPGLPAVGPDLRLGRGGGPTGGFGLQTGGGPTGGFGLQTGHASLGIGTESLMDIQAPPGNGQVAALAIAALLLLGLGGGAGWYFTMGPGASASTAATGEHAAEGDKGNKATTVAASDGADKAGSADKTDKADKAGEADKADKAANADGRAAAGTGDEVGGEAATDDAAVGTADPAAPAAEPDAAPAKPTEIVVTLESDPSGAVVMQDSTRLGTTPLVVRWAADAEPPEVILVRGGYERLIYKLSAPPAGEALPPVALEKKASRPPASSHSTRKPTPAPAPAKPAPAKEPEKDKEKSIKFRMLP